MPSKTSYEEQGLTVIDYTMLHSLTGNQGQDMIHYGPSKPLFRDLKLSPHFKYPHPGSWL